MPLYQYKCNGCGYIDDKFLPVERRHEKFPCSRAINTRKKFGMLPPFICDGEMIFQPIQRTTFKMHDPTEKEAQG